MKYCVDCKNSFFLPDAPRYRRCSKAEGPSSKDAALCGSMRRSVTGACGPSGTLWESTVEEVPNG